MNAKKTFLNKKCIPCHGDMPPLSQEEAQRHLAMIASYWHINEQNRLSTTISFTNFVSAMHFANLITIIAETLGHHPDLKISYGQCVIEIWTHKINGLTKEDFILAAKIDEVKHDS